MTGRTADYHTTHQCHSHTEPPAYSPTHGPQHNPKRLLATAAHTVLPNSPSSGATTSIMHPARRCCRQQHSKPYIVLRCIIIQLSASVSFTHWRMCLMGCTPLSSLAAHVPLPPPLLVVSGLVVHTSKITTSSAAQNRQPWASSGHTQRSVACEPKSDNHRPNQLSTHSTAHSSSWPPLRILSCPPSSLSCTLRGAAPASSTSASSAARCTGVRKE